MKFRYPLLLSLVAVFLFINDSFGEKTRIAMFELVGQGVEQPTAVLLSERLAAWLAEMPSFEVIAPSRVYVLLRERGFQKSCKDDDTACLSQMGKALGVDVVIAGIFAKAEDIHTILLRVVDVATGSVLTTGYQDIPDSVEKILTDWTAKAAKQLETVINTKMANFGSLKIKSVPTGATVFINGKESGKTNLSLDRFLPGKYTLAITLPSCNAIKDSVTVESRKTAELNYQLKHAQGASDTANPRFIKRILVRSILGALTLSSAAAGYYYNHRAVQDIQDERNAKNAYQAAGTNSDFDALFSHYEQTQKTTDKAILSRNVFYGLSGAFAVGLVVSFLF